MTKEELHIDWIPMSYDAVQMIWTNPAMEKFRHRQNFFFLVRGKTVLIFKSVFEENMIELIDTVLAENSSKSGGLTVFVGQVNESKSQLKAIDHALLDNAAKLLNEHFLPAYYNREGPKNYLNLTIISKGADFLITDAIEGAQ